MKNILQTPIKDSDIIDLHAGDIIYLTGILVTGRDDVHRRVVRENLTSPYDFNGGAIFHAGPIVKETERENILISIGPTSSIRMEADEAEFIKKTGVKLIIGKGGMGDRTAQACKEFKALHCLFVGGAAVTAASHVEKILACYWRELGMPECEWVLKVNEFGPLIVNIDAHGNNLFAQNKLNYAANKAIYEAPIIESVKDYMNI